MNTMRVMRLSADEARLQRVLKSERLLLDKLKKVQALYVTAFSSSVPVEVFAVEFFYLIGDVLEGKGAEELPLNKIPKDVFLQEFLDG